MQFEYYVYVYRFVRLNIYCKNVIVFMKEREKKVLIEYNVKDKKVIIKKKNKIIEI